MNKTTTPNPHLLMVLIAIVIIVLALVLAVSYPESLDTDHEGSYTEDTSGDWSPSICNSGICIGIDGGIGYPMPGTNPNGGIQFGPTWP